MTETLSLQMAEPPAKRPRHRRNLLAALLLVPLTALIAALVWFMLGRTALPQGRVETALAPVVAPITAKVLEVYARDGDTVTAGQALARLDTAAFSRYFAEAQTLVRRAMLVQAQRAQAQQAEQANAWRERESALVHQLAQARFEEDGARQLLEQAALEQTRAILRRREADMTSGPDAPRLRAQALQAEQAANLRKNEASLQFERASHARASLEQEIRRMRQDGPTAPPLPQLPSQPSGPAEAVIDATVRAPVAGVLRGSLHVGQTLGGEQTSLFVAPDSNWLVIAALPAEHVGKARVGDVCSITLPSPADSTVWGVIDALSPGALGPNPAPGQATFAPVPEAAPALRAVTGTPGKPLAGAPALTTPEQGNPGTGLAVRDLPDNTPLVRIAVRSHGTASPRHGAQVRVHWWRNNIPGMGALLDWL